MEEQPKPLRVAEVADRLNVSPSTIHRMIERHELQAIHLGQRVVRVPQDEVARVLNQGTEE